MSRIVICEICHTPIATTRDTVLLSRPMNGSMFNSIYHDRLEPPPWPDATEWQYLYCPLCKKRFSQYENRITVEKEGSATHEKEFLMVKFPEEIKELPITSPRNAHTMEPRRDGATSSAEATAGSQPASIVQQTEEVSNEAEEAPLLRCSKCGRVCQTRTGLLSHERACVTESDAGGWAPDPYVKLKGDPSGVGENETAADFGSAKTGGPDNGLVARDR